MTLETQAIYDECRRREENCSYSAASFAIWLRRLRWVRGTCLTLPVIFGGIATWKVATRQAPGLAAVCTLLATVIPLVYRAMELDSKIPRYAKAVADFTNLRDRFRQAANIGLHKDPPTFEADLNELVAKHEKAREPALTPPEWCFRAARRKIKAGHYRHDYDEWQQPQGRLTDEPRTPS